MGKEWATIATMGNPRNHMKSLLHVTQFFWLKCWLFWHTNDTNVNRDRNRFSQFPCPVFLTSPMYFPMFCSMFSYVFPMITRFTRFTGMLAVALEDLRRLCCGTKHHRGRRPWPETRRWSWRAEVVAFSPKDCENPKETYPLKSLIPIIKKTDNKGPNPYTNHS